MTILRGRCQNTELCQIAASQRVVELPDDEPFICPQCSSDLKPLAPRVVANLGSPKMLVLQGLVILAGAGVLGYKLAFSSIKTSAPATNTADTATTAAPQADTAAADNSAPAAMQAAPAPVAAAPIAVPAATPAVTPALATALPPPKILLRLSGADLIASRLAGRLAAGYLALIGDTDITTQPGATPNTLDIVGMQAGSREAISIATSSSADGLNALLRGDTDLALTTRPVSAAELETLSGLGDMTSPDAEHVAGVEAVAVVVNPAIRLAAISRAQLAGIYAGKIHDWSELGAAPGPIHAFLPAGPGGKADSGAALLFPDPAAATAAQTAATDQAVTQAILHDKGGIGLVDLNAAAGARVLAVADANAAPLQPTDVAVATEDYPLTRRLYLYSASLNANPGGNGFVRRFTDYIASPGGQAAVEAAGFVSLTVKTQQAAVPQFASERYRSMVAGATRLSITFRFQPGSTLLDSRALHDTDRLAAYLRARHITGNALVLAGFADNTGTQAANNAVAEKRVATVVDALSRAGITPGKTAGFGSDMPVADNKTQDGREKNRRVEVYLTP